MTFRKALAVLVESARRDIAGSGMGYRTTTDEHRREVAAALCKVWPKIHNRPLDKKDAFNLGISFYMPKEEP